jgi:membrane protease YdiL (CAAX protease family)
MDKASAGIRRQATGRYKAVTPWSALAALATTLAILGLAISIGGLAGGVIARWLAALGWEQQAGRSVLGPMSSVRVLVMLACVQALVIGLVLFAAAMFGGRPRVLLALEDMPGLATMLSAFGSMILLLAPYNLAVYVLSSDSMVHDLRPFAGLMRSNLAWLAVIVIGVGAPLSEELLFRGFLQAALAKSRIGYFGASLVTTTGWTALHAGYSPAGLIEVFVIGLTFSWLLWRTGSLWVPMLCHAAYNSLLLVMLGFVELPA